MLLSKDKRLFMRRPCEARQGKQQLLGRRETIRAIVLRLLAKESHRKAELRITDGDTSR